MNRSAALDTNILIYAHVSDYSEHPAVRTWLLEFLRQCEVFYITWQVVYEYVRIMTHPRILRHPLTVAQTLSDLTPYLEDSRCRFLQETDVHWAIVSELFKKLPSAKGNFIHDCHYAALLKEHAVETIVTADSDFLKFQFLEVVNPVLSAS